MGANLLFGRGCRFAPSLIAVAGFGGGFLSPETASIVTFSSALAFASINMSKGWRNSAASAPLFHEDAESAELSRRFPESACLSNRSPPHWIGRPSDDPRSTEASGSVRRATRQTCGQRRPPQSARPAYPRIVFRYSVLKPQIVSLQPRHRSIAALSFVCMALFLSAVEIQSAASWPSQTIACHQLPQAVLRRCFTTGWFRVWRG